jgi:hypothetical protein
VDGRTLDELLEEGELSDRDIASIGVALAGALDHAHAHGVIHRDVKPGNVMVPRDPHGEAGLAKLTDFGVARLVGDDPLTRTSDVVGTLAYMAPEQAEGEEVGAEADLYALGIVLYEALTGVNPVRGGGPAATARRLGEPLPPVRRVRRDLPRPLADALDRAVRPYPEERGSVDEMRAALSASIRDLDDEPGTVAPAHFEPVITRTRRYEPAPPPAPTPNAQRPTPEAPPQPEAPRPRRTLPERLLASAGAAGLVAVGGIAYPANLTVPVAALAAGAAVAVFLLPRLAWIVIALAVIGVAAVQSDGAGVGVAMLLAAALVPVPLLLWRAPAWWSVPGVAPLLGAISVAGAFPAVAGQARTAWRRAVVGALGAWWLLLAEALSGQTLLLGRVRGEQPRALWHDSAAQTADHVLRPLATSGALALVALWALAAAVLPYLVRGRELAPAALGAAIWAVALAAGTAAVVGAAHVHASGSTAALVGAALAAPLALVATAVRARFGGAGRSPGVS